MLVISSLLLLFVDETIAWSLGVLDLSGPSKSSGYLEYASAHYGILLRNLNASHAIP